MAATVSLTLKPVVSSLEAIGLKKRAGGVFTIELGGPFVGTVGLNRATQGRRAGELEVNPIVGVRHQEVERVVAQLTEAAFHPYLPATVLKPIGYLMPDKRYRAWDITPQNAEDQAADLAAAVETWGFAFMRNASSLDSLIKFAEMKYGYDFRLAYTLPVARALNGDRARAESEVAGTLADFGSDEYPAAQEFRQFSERFAEWLKSQDEPR